MVPQNIKGYKADFMFFYIKVIFSVLISIFYVLEHLENLFQKFCFNIREHEVNDIFKIFSYSQRFSEYPQEVKELF